MKDKYKFNCKICKRRAEIRCIIFHYLGEAMGIPHSYPYGEHILSCVECNMSYNAQFYEMTNKDIESWARWIIEAFKDYDKTKSKTGGKKNVRANK